MQDRIPTYPGRVKLIPVQGQDNTFDLVRADDPVTEGTPINKATLLKDETVEFIGGDVDTMVPDDALVAILSLAASKGSGVGETAELEDFRIEVGTFTNTGAGNQNFKFREPFESEPFVFLQVNNFEGWVVTRGITNEGFTYCLYTGTGAVTTSSYYTAAGTAANSTHSSNTLVSGVTMPGLTTTTAATIQYIAIEYGGDE